MLKFKIRVLQPPCWTYGPAAGTRINPCVTVLPLASTSGTRNTQHHHWLGQDTDKEIKDVFFLNVGVLTRGTRSQLVNAACFLVPDDDAKDNTVTHGLSWFRLRGRTSSKGGVRGHCIILHPECL